MTSVLAERYEREGGGGAVEGDFAEKRYDTQVRILLI
jgi:hypothetical protein